MGAIAHHRNHVTAPHLVGARIARPWWNRGTVLTALHLVLANFVRTRYSVPLLPAPQPPSPKHKSCRNTRRPTSRSEKSVGRCASMLHYMSESSRELFQQKSSLCSSC